MYVEKVKLLPEWSIPRYPNFGSLGYKPTSCLLNYPKFNSLPNDKILDYSKLKAKKRNFVMG